MMERETSMKQTKTGRVLAALFLGMVFGLFLHFRQMRYLGLGRDAFLAQQSRYFDQITRLHSIGFMAIAGIILVAIGIGLYELIAAAVTRVLPPSTVEE
jgi:hypothetical protein